MTRDLADEIMGIDHAAVNAFTWIQWEVSARMRRGDARVQLDAASALPGKQRGRAMHRRVSAALS